MSAKPSFDPSIPVLTEVFQDQPARADAVEHAPVAPVMPVVPVAARPAEPEWAQLEQRLCERIVDQLQGHIDIALQNALAGLHDEISRGLRQTVAAAVAEELAHLRPPPK